MADLAPRLPAIQHIACEPPGAYEDELLARGGTLARVEIDVHGAEMLGLARRLFGAWLDRVVAPALDRRAGGPAADVAAARGHPSVA